LASRYATGWRERSNKSTGSMLRHMGKSQLTWPGVCIITTGVAHPFLDLEGSKFVYYREFISLRLWAILEKKHTIIFCG